MSDTTAEAAKKSSKYVEHIHFDSKWANKRGSGGLAPSKSTVYISNLPFSLTNNDLHKILEKFGRCIKVSIPRDDNRRSKGIAFALFLEREPCIRVINAFHGKKLFGRTLKCAIAVDNGRAREFIRRKEYPDKTRCWECGEYGHLSYKCPKNVLGERKRPRRKKKKRKEKKEEEDDYYNPDITLAEAIEEDAFQTALYNQTIEQSQLQKLSAKEIVGSLSNTIQSDKTAPIVVEHDDYSQIIKNPDHLPSLNIAKQTLLQTQDGDVFIRSQIEVSEDTSTTHVVDIQQPVLLQSRDKEEKVETTPKPSPKKRYRQDTYFSDEETLDEDD